MCLNKRLELASKKEKDKLYKKETKDLQTLLVNWSPLKNLKMKSSLILK